jgi:plasmid maintenance system antidote protein VapI
MQAFIEGRDQKMSPVKLKNYLVENGVKASWLSKQIGVSKQHLSNYIHGRYQLSESKIHRLNTLIK